jgi:hypothetical protein
MSETVTTWRRSRSSAECRSQIEISSARAFFSSVFRVLPHFEAASEKLGRRQRRIALLEISLRYNGRPAEKNPFPLRGRTQKMGLAIGEGT